MTRTIHGILQALGFIISIGTVATNIVPPKYQPYVVLVVSGAQGILAWYNHSFNPDGTPASVAYVAKLLILFLLLSGTAMAQTPTPAISPFSTTLSAVNLPGSNGATMAGTLAGFNYQVTPNFGLKQTNLISSGAQTNGFYGGGDYTLPFLSKKLNNMSPTTNGYDFQFQLTGSAGALRVTKPDGTVSQSWSALFGGRVNYAIKGSKMFSLAIEVQDLYASRDLPKKNNLLIALGPSIHFGH